MAVGTFGWYGWYAGAALLLLLKEAFWKVRLVLLDAANAWFSNVNYPS